MSQLTDRDHYEFDPQRQEQRSYVVRLKEHDGFRNVRFADKQSAMRFKEAAEEDGTYWGYYED